MMKRSILVIAVALLAGSLTARAADYSVLDFGAVPDGVTLNTHTIQHAIDVVNERGGGRLVFPQGRYLSGSLHLKSNVTLHLEAGATLLASANPLDHDYQTNPAWESLVLAYKQRNVAVTGQGCIDGQGFALANNMLNLVHKGVLKDRLVYDRPGYRPQNLYFRECHNVRVEDVSLFNAANRCHTYEQCRNVRVERVHSEGKAFWHEDGIDVIDCDSVLLKDCWFDAADDVLCFKSDDPKCICQNVWVENCVGRSSANGLKFGTTSMGGFRNFKIKNITIYDTFRSAITFDAVDGGFVENIDVDGVKSINTGNVIYLRIGKRMFKERDSYMRNIRIANVHAIVPATKPDAGYGYEGPVEDNPRNISPAAIVGLPGMPITDVTLQNVTIEYPGDGTPFLAKVGTTAEELDGIPEMPSAYPEFSQFKELPAWGFYIRHAEGIVFDGVRLKAAAKDYRPAIVLDDVHRSDFRRVTVEEPDSKGKSQLVEYKSSQIQTSKNQNPKSIK